MDGDRGNVSPGLAEIVNTYQADFWGEIVNLLDQMNLCMVNLEAEPGNKSHLVALCQLFHTITGLSTLLQDAVCHGLSKATEELVEASRKYGSNAELSTINQFIQSSGFLRRMALNPGISDEPRFFGEVSQHIQAMKQSQMDLLMMVRQTLEKEVRIGEILIHDGTMAKNDVDDVLDKQKKSMGSMKFGEILLKEKRVDATDIIQAIRKQRIRSASPGCLLAISNEQIRLLRELIKNLYATGQSVHTDALLRFGSKDQFSARTATLVHDLAALELVLAALGRVPLSLAFSKLKQTLGSLFEESRQFVRIDTTGDDTEVEKDIADRMVQPMAELVALIAAHDRELNSEEVLSLIELAAANEKGVLAIEIATDSRQEASKYIHHQKYEQIAGIITQLGGKMVVDDSKQGIRIRILFSAREGIV